MPYKDPERKKEWERSHRAERLARQLRQSEATAIAFASSDSTEFWKHSSAAVLYNVH